MNVFKKLQEARVKLHGTPLNKSGKNNFAKFNYFELADFIPTVTKIFNEMGLCGVVSFTATDAFLTVYNVDGEKDDFITFTSPLVMASMDRVQPIQSLGATHTYLRRYLWLMVMEIVENDSVDAAEPSAPATPSASVPFKPLKAPIKPKATTATGEFSVQTDDVSKNLSAAIKGIEVLLTTAKTRDDLMAIFQKNKIVFDEIKAGSEDQYNELIKKFSETQDALTKE